MNTEELNNIYDEIKDLEKEKQIVLNFLRENEKKIDDINKKIRILTKKFPTCYSCGKHYHPKNMTIATQEDLDDYYDKNEGYCGPEIGEYYCGCC
jgi:RNA polymerase-binding transcription factor DksA